MFVPSKSLVPQSCGSSVIKSHCPPKSKLLGVLSPLTRSSGWKIWVAICSLDECFPNLEPVCCSKPGSNSCFLTWLEISQDQRCSESSHKALCIPGSRDSTKTEPDPPLSFGVFPARHRSTVACCGNRGSGCSKPGAACGISSLVGSQD